MGSHEELIKRVIEKSRKQEAIRRERERADSRRWRERHHDRYRVSARKRDANLRVQCLQHYCGSGVPFCQCSGCHVTQLEFLGIDHIDGGGVQHRKEIGSHGGTGFYGWLKRNNFPDGFQVLCHNCNLAKGYYGKCPHEQRVPLIDISLSLEG